MLTLFEFLRSLLGQTSGGASPNAPESAVAAILTSTHVPSLELVLTRTEKTTDGVFGRMSYNDEFICFTMENRALAIPAGTYSLEITYSPHFGREMPLLGGTSPRTGIRLHPANWPAQLEGCVALGQSIDGDSLSNSVLAFDMVLGIIRRGIADGGISIQISDSQ